MSDQKGIDYKNLTSTSETKRVKVMQQEIHLSLQNARKKCI